MIGSMQTVMATDEYVPLPQRAEERLQRQYCKMVKSVL